MEPVAHGLTHDDLLAMPEDRRHRHELIGGDHFVSPAPQIAHQQVVGDLHLALRAWADPRGAMVLLGPTDVRFSHDTVLEPDLLVMTADTAGRLDDDRAVTVTPELVVEVSSPSTRSHDQVRKRRVYEQHGVRTFWFVDREALTVSVYELGDDDRYTTTVLDRAGLLTAGGLPGLEVPVAEVLRSG